MHIFGGLVASRLNRDLWVLLAFSRRTSEVAERQTTLLMGSCYITFTG